MFDHNETLPEALERNVRDALFEDVGVSDWTAQLVPANQRVKARLLVREEAVLCGREWFEACLFKLDPQATVKWAYDEGALMTPDTDVCLIEANARALLTAERPGINFVQTLSAVATLTHHHMKAIEGASPNPRGCVVLDTRKTLPGLRLAQKYAVRVGGGANQRLALYDGILIKENHIAAAGSVSGALRNAQALVAAQASSSASPSSSVSASRGDITIQVEVETLDQLREALAAGAVSVLLDNFSEAMMRDAVRINQEIAEGRALLEVSGGVTMDQLRGIAATGVDRISIGKLTKDVKAVDFSLRVLERIEA
jgi:nicotinate-nucleotide pyrophosphorylase (carboxylating)